MTERRPVNLWLSQADFVIFVAYVAMLCIFVPFHEPWADEAQAWLLSRDLSVYSLLFRNLRHEGHPALWYLLLWVPTHLHVSYSLFNWFSAAIAACGIYVLLGFAPFPFYLRALLPFTFFLGYQYSIVARSYVLFPLLGFLVAHVYRLARPRPLWMGILLGLLANVSVHGTIVALAFAALYAWKMKRQGTGLSRDTAWGATIFFSSILLVAVCLWPTAGTLPRLSPTLNRIVDRLSVPAPVEDLPPSATVSSSVTPSPVPTAPAPKGQGGFIRGKGKLAAVPLVLSFAFASSHLLALLFEGVVVVWLFRRGQLKLILPMALLSIFLVFVYGTPWHFGLLWITCLMVLWTAWDASTATKTMALQNFVAIFLALLCVLQLPWTFHAFSYDARNPTSPDKATAAYLQSRPAGSRLAGFGMSAGVQPYFAHNIFFNQHHSFTYFAPDPSVFTVQQVIAQRPDIVVSDSFNTPLVRASGYRMTHVFCGALYFPNLSIEQDCLSIFEPPSGPSTQPAP